MKAERMNTDGGGDDPNFYTNGMIDQSMLRQGIFGNSQSSNS
jgi:hypothetical protein